MPATNSPASNTIPNTSITFITPTARTTLASLWAVVSILAVSIPAGFVSTESASAAPPKRAENLVYLDNGVIRIGVDLNAGGSIGYLADAKNRESVINIYDYGRWVGQSYYAGPKPFGKSHKAWPDWPWNPVSAGDVNNRPARVLESRCDGREIYVRAEPRQWALNNVPGDCTFETWITLDASTAHVRCRLKNARSDHSQYEAMDQELPAVYTIGRLHRLMTYTGEHPFAGEPATEIPKKPLVNGRPEWTYFAATEHWAALVNDDNWGLGVVHPGAERFLGGFGADAPYTGGPRDNPTGYVAPSFREVLDDDIVYEYRYALVLGNLADIRARAAELCGPERPPVYRFANDRRHFWFSNATDAGWPIKGKLVVALKGEDPQVWGPETHWSAADVPKLYIRAAYKTTLGSSQLFFERADRPGIHEACSVRFDVIGDGVMRTYEANLGACTEYHGAIRRIRLDPVDRGGKGEQVEIESISALPPAPSPDEAP